MVEVGYDSRLLELVERLKLPLESEDFGSLEKQVLEELITVSRSVEGRAKLASLRIVVSLVVLLQRFLEVSDRMNDSSCSTSESSDLSSPSSDDELLGNLLLLLKLIRNLCAGDSTNQDTLLDSGGVKILTTVASTLLSFGSKQAQAHDRSRGSGGESNSAPEMDSTLERITARFESGAVIFRTEQGCASVSPAVGCLQMMLQLLGNFSRRGEACQTAVWENFFPSVLLELVALRVEKINGPLWMVLYTCCHANPRRSWELCQGNGAALVALLIVATMDGNLCTISNSKKFHSSEPTNSCVSTSLK